MEIAISVNGVPVRLTEERWEEDCMDKQIGYARTGEKNRDWVNKIVSKIRQLTPHLLRLPTKRLYTTYDEEADVLYVSFEKPPQATHSDMRDDGVLLNYRGKELVGITILDASTVRNGI